MRSIPTLQLVSLMGIGKEMVLACQIFGLIFGHIGEDAPPLELSRHFIP